VDPRAGLDDVEKRKFLTLPGFELHLSGVQPVTSRYTDCATPAPSLAETDAKCKEGQTFFLYISVCDDRSLPPARSSTRGSA
jgi:hypothetical protein